MADNTPERITGSSVRFAALVLLFSSGLPGQAVYVPNFTTSTVSGYIMNPSTGALAPIPDLPLKTGTSPIQALIHPSGKFLYVLGAGSGDITLYSITAPSGALSVIPCPHCDAYSPSGMAVDPSGQTLFVTSLELSSVTPYSIDPATGGLTRGAAAGTGRDSKPASPVVDPSGRYLYVVDSNTGRVFGFLIGGGSLTSIPGSPFTSAAGACSVAASRTAVFVANQYSGDVSMYQLGAGGALTQIGIPVPTGGNPTSVAVDPSGNFVYVANQIQLVALNTTPNGNYPLTYLRAYNTGTVPSFAAVDPDGNFVFVVNAVSNDVSGFAISAGGTLIPAGASSTTGVSGSRMLTVLHIGDTTGISTSPGYPAPLKSASYGTPVAVKGNVRNTLNPGTIPRGTVTVAVTAPVALCGTVALDAIGGFSWVFDASTQYLPPGSNIMEIAYNPGTGFEAPAPLWLAYTVTKAVPALTVLPPVNPMAGEPVTIAVSAVQVGGRYPTGSVIFSVDGAVTQSAVPLVDGSASVLYTASTGDHAITVAYSGDDWFSSGGAAPVTFRAKRATSTTVTSSSTSIVYGQGLVFTATVSAAGDLVGGAVDFFVDGARINAAPVPVGAGRALFGPHGLAAGSHAITARFGGDANSLASSNIAAPLMVTVNRAAANVSTPQLSGTAVYGPLTFSLAVATANLGSDVPVGEVSLKDGGTTVGRAILANGAATLVVPSMGAGDHLLTAAYSGDASYEPGTSAPQSLLVAKSTPELTVRPLPESLVSGQTVSLTAVLSASGVATGTVVFFDLGTRISPAPITILGGQASFAYALNGAGTHRISAVYSGDANCNGVDSVHAPLVITVGPALTAIGEPASYGLATYGQPLKFTAVASAVAPGGGTPGGVVTFRDWLAVIGTAPLEAGVASLTISTLAVGSHAISAVYGGASDFAGSTSPPLSFTENKSPTLTALTVLQAPGSTLLSASVSSSGAYNMPAGSVQFFNGVTLLGTASLVGSSGSATATFSLGALSGTVMAVYTGDGNFQASTSPSVKITAIPQTATSLSMQVTPSPAMVGHPVTCTLNLSWSGGPPPGGTIQLYDGGIPIGDFGARAQVVFHTTLAAGSHNLTASYTGDATYLPSSARSVLVVNRNPVSVLATAGAGVAAFGQNIALTAKVITPAVTPLALPAGKVTFMEGSTVLGSASLLNGVATAAFPTLEPGTHQIVSIYGGDSIWELAASNTVSVTVTKAATAIEICAVAGSAEHDRITLRANLVVTSPGAGVPSGSVMFVEAVTQEVLATVPLTGITATAHIPTGARPRTIIAVYGGDARFLDSRSASETTFSILNAASYSTSAFAPDQIVTVFCPELTSETLAPAMLPLPYTLGGVSVALTDSADIVHHAPLFYVSPEQLTFLIPPDMAHGPATVRISTLQGTAASAVVAVGPVSPGLFTANASGKGAASAQIVRVHADGTQDPPENTAVYDSISQAWTALPIDPASRGDDLILVLYATGIRHHSTPVAIAMGGQTLPVLYGGRQSTYLGLDQVNVLLPPSAQRGTAELSITTDGQVSNMVTLAFR